MKQHRGPIGSMWVDAVGGFLVFLQNEITIGQATPDSNVDLQLLGDLSRQHAVIRRVGEDYLLCPISQVTLNGRNITAATCLSDGDQIGLGGSVRLEFRQPNVLSNTARLNLLSHHRTSPKADGILLIGQTCLLGPEPDNHLVCRGSVERTILIPKGDEGFQFKSNRAVMIDEVSVEQTGVIPWGSRLASDDFAFYLERL